MQSWLCRALISTLTLSSFFFPATAARAAITYPYTVDEKPQVLFGDSGTIPPYQGLENYVQNYVNGYAHISFTYTHDVCCYATYYPFLYITDTDPRTISGPSKEAYGGIQILPSLPAPTDVYFVDLQFDARGYTLVVKHLDQTLVVDRYIPIDELSESDWVSLVNRYPLGNPPSQYSMAFTPVPVRSDPVVTGNSNVLFLPGIEATRLYYTNPRGLEERLWEPRLNDSLKELYLDSSGASVREDIYARVGEIIGETSVGGINIYKSFIAKMDELRDNGSINDWKPAPYDWRLSLDEIVGSGRQTLNYLTYLNSTSTPYIIQELKHLAGTSQTGKVTVIAHSNGGLVAKKISNILGADAPRLIDKIIFVAVPQAGTPAAAAALLHGYDQDIDVLGLEFVSKTNARIFASTSPMTYNLLPSEDYFTWVDDPIISFDPLLTDWISRYEPTIHSGELLHAFLADAYGKVSAHEDIDQPIQGHENLLVKAQELHNELDDWSPPAGIEVIQVAGWGVPTTVSGITYKKKDAGVTPEPNFTIDGDGTVVVPSALWSSTSAGVKNYWLDLDEYNRNHRISSGFGAAPFKHSRIFEPIEFLNFLSDQITRSSKSISEYIYLSTEAPIKTNARLRYALHSPLTLNIYDRTGRHTGISTTTGRVEEQIPNTYYSEFGESKYIFSDATDPMQLVMYGYATGTFTLDIEEYINDTSIVMVTFKDIPTTPDTIVRLSTQSDVSTLSSMLIDKNGDGTADIALVPNLNGVATIRYGWNGFSPPINDTARQKGQRANVFKGGSTIPVKFQLKQANGTITQASTTPIWLTPQQGNAITASIDESVYSDPGTEDAVYKWDSVEQQYVYNWNTQGLATGFWYKIYAKLDDGQTISAIVGLK